MTNGAQEEAGPLLSLKNEPKGDGHSPLATRNRIRSFTRLE
jgi:hypothetical protein